VCSNVQHPEGYRAMVHLLYVLACVLGVLSPSLQRIMEVVLGKPHPGMVCCEAWLGLQAGTPEPSACWDHGKCICVCTCVCVSACVHMQESADRVPRQKAEGLFSHCLADFGGFQEIKSEETWCLPSLLSGETFLLSTAT